MLQIDRVKDIPADGHVLTLLVENLNLIITGLPTVVIVGVIAIKILAPLQLDYDTGLLAGARRFRTLIHIQAIVRVGRLLRRGLSRIRGINQVVDHITTVPASSKVVDKIRLHLTSTILSDIHIGRREPGTGAIRSDGTLKWSVHEGVALDFKIGRSRGHNQLRIVAYKRNGSQQLRTLGCEFEFPVYQVSLDTVGKDDLLPIGGSATTGGQIVHERFLIEEIEVLDDLRRHVTDEMQVALFVGKREFRFILNLIGIASLSVRMTFNVRLSLVQRPVSDLDGRNKLLQHTAVVTEYGDVQVIKHGNLSHIRRTGKIHLPVRIRDGHRKERFDSRPLRIILSRNRLNLFDFFLAGRQAKDGRGKGIEYLFHRSRFHYSVINPSQLLAGVLSVAGSTHSTSSSAIGCLELLRGSSPQYQRS